VLDTGKDFTVYGKAIIALLIQLGGLGIMTFSLSLLSLAGGNISIKWRFTLEDLYSDIKTLPIKSLLKKIVIYTLTIEMITAVFLFMGFIKQYSIKDAIGHSLFHSVSAFCNAGFSTFPDSLTAYRNNPLIIITVSAAIILGGLGFLVLVELMRGKIQKPGQWFRGMSLHSKLVIVITTLLIICGTLFFYILEWDHSMNGFSAGESLLTSFFQSVTCRTAGFNTIDISSLRPGTLFMMIALMFIGGAPGSIAGGIKITTIGVVFLLIYTKFKGKEQIVIWDRAIDRNTIEKSTTLVILSLFFVCFSTFLMLTLDEFDMHHTFLSVFFETVSAFGTVGLSMGTTTQLTLAGKLLVCAIMFIGRLGPLTLMMALTSNIKKVNIKYPEENIMTG